MGHLLIYGIACQGHATWLVRLVCGSIDAMEYLFHSRHYDKNPERFAIIDKALGRHWAIHILLFS